MKQHRYNAATGSKKIRGVILVRVIAILIVTVILGAAQAYSFSDQTTTERILGENRDFIEFVNICLTNFGKDRIPDMEKKFFDVYQYHFNGQVSYLQSDYKNAFYNVRQSQKKNVSLSSEIIQKVYLEDAKVILDRMAPEIIKSKSSRARLYLTLGYRDRAVGRNYEVMSDASNPRLYSYKIFRYIEGVKLARRAKRYGFLSLYESRDLKTKRIIFNHLITEENRMGNGFFVRFVNKEDKEIIQEMNKKYDDIQQWESSQPRVTVKKEGEDDEAIESKVARRVRYRKEKQVAKSILFSEFEKAEDVLREYIRDFNFKLIYSTLRVMMEQQSPEAGDAIDYNSYLLHHFDNYSRIYDPEAIKEGGLAAEAKTKTILERLTPQIKVVGDLRREGAIEEEETRPSDEKK